MNIYRARNLQKKRFKCHDLFKKSLTFLYKGNLFYGNLFYLSDIPRIGIGDGARIQMLLDRGIHITIEYITRGNNPLDIPEGMYVLESIMVD